MIGKVGAIVAMQAERVHQEQEKTLDAVFSGMARLAAPFAWIAGTGLAGRTGSASAAIDTVGRRGGIPFREEGIAPNTTGRYKRTYGARGNLRNGANGGPVYVNCRNRLDRTNWNYLG